MYEIKINNLEDLEKFAKELTKSLNEGDVFLLHGNLGSGKTTLTQFIAKELGITQPVTSPTFNLINCYTEGKFIFYHVDLYRIETPEEIESLDMDSFLYPNGISFIEWAERAEDYMPGNAIEIYIEREEDGRRITIHGNHLREKELIRKLKGN